MNEINILLIFLLIRIILCFIILLLNIPIYIKVLLFIFSDFIDSRLPYTLGLYKNKISKNKNYHKYDKVVDSICYFMLYLYLIQDKKHVILLSSLLLYRFIGTYLFLRYGKRILLFIFPNFFLGATLILSAGMNIKTLWPYLFIFKMIHEYSLHIAHIL